MDTSFLNNTWQELAKRPGIIIAAGTTTIVMGSAWAICKTFKVTRTVDAMQNCMASTYVADGDYWQDEHVYSKKEIALQAAKMYIGPAITVIAGIGMIACGLHCLGGVGVVLGAAPAAAGMVNRISDVPVQAKAGAVLPARDENEVNDDGDCAENTGYGRYLFREPTTGRMFYSDKATIRQAVHNIDDTFGQNGDTQLASFFTEMCMDMCEAAYDYIWMYDPINARHLDVSFENYELNKTDCPCLNICWSVEPQFNWN